MAGYNCLMMMIRDEICMHNVLGDGIDDILRMTHFFRYIFSESKISCIASKYDDIYILRFRKLIMRNKLLILNYNKRYDNSN